MKINYIEKCDGVIIVFSINDKKSKEKSKEKAEEILNIKKLKKFPFIFVGNKLDLNGNREVTFEEGKELANKFSSQYIEASAKNSENIEEIFVNIGLKILNFENEEEI